MKSKVIFNILILSLFIQIVASESVGVFHSGWLFHTGYAKINLGCDLKFTHWKLSPYGFIINSTFFGIYPSTIVEMTLNQLDTAEATTEFTSDGTDTTWNWTWNPNKPFLKEIAGQITSLDLNGYSSSTEKLSFSRAGSGSADVKINCAEKGEPAWVQEDGVNITFVYVAPICSFTISSSEIVVGWGKAGPTPLKHASSLALDAMGRVLSISLVLAIFTLLLRMLAQNMEELSEEITQQIDKYAAIIMAICFAVAFICIVGLLTYV